MTRSTCQEVVWPGFPNVKWAVSIGRILRPLRPRRFHRIIVPLLTNLAIQTFVLYDADMANTPSRINMANKLAQISELWSPKIIAQVNDHQFKLVKFKGEFVWHKHDDTDEVFIVIKGSMRIEFRGRDSVTLAEGEMLVVPRDVEHRPIADEECHAMLLERSGTINTGDTDSDMTAPHDDWI